jgi:hypothetical protein
MGSRRVRGDDHRVDGSELARRRRTSAHGSAGDDGLRLLPDQELLEYFCTDNEKDRQRYFTTK